MTCIKYLKSFTENDISSDGRKIKQEGWLSPTERASVSAISQGTLFGYLTRVELRYVVAFSRIAGGSTWLRQESLRHILASPGYAPETIAVNVTWMKREFNACQTPRSMYPSILNRLPVVQAVSLKVCHFSTFWPPLGQSR